MSRCLSRSGDVKFRPEGGLHLLTFAGLSKRTTWSANATGDLTSDLVVGKRKQEATPKV